MLCKKAQVLPADSSRTVRAIAFKRRCIMAILWILGWQGGFFFSAARVLKRVRRKPTEDNRTRGHSARVLVDHNVTMGTPSLITPKSLQAKGTRFRSLVARHRNVRQQVFSSAFSNMGVFSTHPGLGVIWNEHF